MNLIMTATVEGFRQVLEVETPQGAANLAPKSITDDLNAENVTLKAGPGGGVDAVDGNGNTLSRSPAARMWNSIGDASAPAGAGAALFMAPTAGGEGVTTAANWVSAGPREEGDPLAGPGVGDELAVRDLAVEDGSVTVTPDADLVAAPRVTNSLGTAVSVADGLGLKDEPRQALDHC
ncbi:hypothetical protein [Streptomyces sp. OfavH-34-F]|uniref:hypothetical protein n=1 Tax=Streptomyces sp. OfavH-34-F TaxID=2917760 RepID=UPI001EF31BB5|nr:hypothetical protein [Streptomyces sp. OfavH-34-F]